MQVEIVGHHGGAQDPDGQVQGVAVDPRLQPLKELAPGGLCPEDLNAETGGDHGDQRQNKRLDGADSEALKRQQQQRIGGGKQHAQQQRDAE